MEKKTNRKKHPGGRPEEFTCRKGTEFKKAVLHKLEEAFGWEYSNAEACFHAGIGETLFYQVVKANPKLKDRFEILKKNNRMRFKQNVAKFLKEKDKDMTKYYGDRRMKRYKPKQNSELTGKDGEPIIVLTGFNYVKPEHKNDNSDDKASSEAAPGMGGTLSGEQED